MTKKETLPGRSLATLQRLRELELRQARVEGAATDATVKQHEERLGALHDQIAQTETLTHGQVTRAQGVSAQALRALRDYLSWQGQTLRERQDALREAQGLAEEARIRTKHRFEQLSIVERLRERRARDALQERQRREQKRLDDQAMLIPPHRTFDQYSNEK